MATHARITSALLPATPAAPALLGSGPRFTLTAGPALFTDADQAIQAVRGGVDRYLRDAGAVVARRGVAYLRRGAWAAFLHTGERVGQFSSAREATAALGGAA